MSTTNSRKGKRTLPPTPEYLDMAKRVDGITEKVEAIDRNTFEILLILKGDSTGLTKGLVRKLKDQEDRLRKMEKMKDQVRWAILGATSTGVIGGALSPKLIEFIKKLVGISTLLLFTSCMTQKKREDIAHRYLRENPKVIIELAATMVPPRISPGKVIEKPGPIIWLRPDTVECPDGTTVIVDSIMVECPPSTHRVDTIENTAMIEHQKNLLQSLQSRLDKKEALLEAEKVIQESIKKTSNRYRNALIIVILSIFVYLILKSYLKKIL